MIHANVYKEGWNLWINVYCVSNCMVKGVETVINLVVESVRLTGH